MEGIKFQIGADLSNLQKGLNEATSKIDEFAKKASDKFDKLGKKLTSVGKNMTIFTGAVSALAAGGFMLAKSLGQTADRLLDLSDITGMATDKIQEYQHVAKIAGVSTEAVTNATEGLIRRLKGVEDDGGGAVQVMQKLGIATKTAGGDVRNSGDLMDDLIRKLAEMDNVTERNTYGAQVFGGAWKDMAPILSMGADGIEAIRKEAHDLGLVMSNESLQEANAFRQEMERLTAQFDAAKNKLGAQLIPVISSIFVPLIQRYVLPAIEKLGNFLQKVIDYFKSLSPETKKLVAVMGGLVLAAGPVLLALGGIVKLLPILISGFTLLTGPVGLIVAGIVALTVAVVKNWNTVKKWAQDIVNYFIRLYNQSIVFRAGIESLILNFKNLWEVGKFVFNALVTIVKLNFQQMATAIKGLGTIIEGVFTLSPSKIKKGFTDVFTEGTNNVKTALKSIGNDATTLFSNIGKNTSEAFTNTFNKRLEEVDFSKGTSKIKETVSDAVASGVVEGMARGMSGQGGTRRPQLQGIGAKAAGVSGMEFLDAEIISRTDTQITEFVDMAVVKMQAFQMQMEEFANQATELVQGSLAETFAGLGETIGQALSNGTSLVKGLGNTLLAALGGFLKQFGKMMIQYGVAALNFEKVRAALISGLGGFGAAAALIAAGAVLTAAGAAVASQARGGLAGGGGGGGGASVASNVTSQGFTASSMNTGNNEVVFRIAGTDLIGVLDRARGQNQRLNG